MPCSLFLGQRPGLLLLCVAAPAPGFPPVLPLDQRMVGVGESSGRPTQLLQAVIIKFAEMEVGIFFFFPSLIPRLCLNSSFTGANV